MNKGNKIGAFTLVDILTGMVITSIIISMVFYLFTALNKQVADYGSTRNQLNGFLLLKTDLMRQFDQSGGMVATPKGFDLTSGNSSISYMREGNLLLRKTPYLTDTLTQNLEELTLYLTQDKDGNETDNVKALTTAVNLNGQVIKSHFYKDFGLIQSINQALLHEY